MEIQSAFASGVQGFQKASEDANQAAANIASQTSQNTNEIDSVNESTTSNVNSAAAQSNQVIDINQEVVNLKVAEHQAKASAQVIQSADESLGTLIDVTA